MFFQKTQNIIFAFMFYDSFKVVLYSSAVVKLCVVEKIYCVAKTVKIFFFQTFKIFLFQTVKISFSNYQNIRFKTVKIFLFRAVKIIVFKLSKFSFSNCQIFLFQTVKFSKTVTKK